MHRKETFSVIFQHKNLISNARSKGAAAKIRFKWRCLSYSLCCKSFDMYISSRWKNKKNFFGFSYLLHILFEPYEAAEQIIEPLLLTCLI